MRMLNRKSVLCSATITVSITSGSKTDGDKQVLDKSLYGLIIKMHNAFGIPTMDFYGPSQQGSTGMMNSSRITTGVQSMA